MNKIYSTVIVILVIIVALFAISTINSREGQEVQSTNLQVELNNNNMDNQNNNNEEKEIFEKVEQENGLVIETTQTGEGDTAENGKIVAVHYTGKLEDGTVFDSSIQRGTPIEFVLGSGMVIQGWEQGILGMKIGEKRVLTIPSDLGYGPNGYGPIPGGATLIFDVELVGVK